MESVAMKNIFPRIPGEIPEGVKRISHEVRSFAEANPGDGRPAVKNTLYHVTVYYDENGEEILSVKKEPKSDLPSVGDLRDKNPSAGPRPDLS